MKRETRIFIMTLFFFFTSCKTMINVKKSEEKIEGSKQIIKKYISFEKYCDSTELINVSKWTLDCIEKSNPWIEKKNTVDNPEIIYTCKEEAIDLFCSYKKGIIYKTKGSLYFIPCNEVTSEEDKKLCGCD